METDPLAQLGPASITTGAATIPNRAFWTLHVAYWSAYLAIVYVALLPVSELPPGRLLLNKSAWAVSGLVISLPLSRLYAAILSTARPWRLVAIVGMASTATAGVWLGAYILLARSFASPTPSGTIVLTAYAGLGVALVAWSAVYVAAFLWWMAASERLARVDAERLMREAQLHALRQPLNPHFLFNALASVRALVAENAERARDAITLLADLLRDSLQDSADDLVLVSQEVEAVRRYLALESMRFEDRLCARIDIDPSVLRCHVPTFAIRSLVENAMKHGQPLGTGGLEVALTVASGPGNAVRIQVSNPGHLNVGPPAGAAVGLRNLRARLQRLFPGRHDFSLTEANGVVMAVLTLRAAPRT